MRMGYEKVELAMRIVSQAGMYDLPYEEGTFRIFPDGRIAVYALSDLTSDSCIIIAEYSTREKAIKAMEMCREKYSQCEFNKLVIPKTDENLAKVSISLTGNVVNQIAEKYVFQFPEDEEVE